MDNINTVGFEGLKIGPFELDRVAFSIGDSFNVYWYAIIITLGIVLAIIFAMINAKRVGLVADDIIDVALWGTPIALIGARLYYIIFSLDEYIVNGSLDWKAVFSFRNGGIAIYGAVIFAFITGYIVCRVKRVNFLAMYDIGALGFMIGQAVGRWGNFVNAEAHGGETTLPWGMSINGSAPVHPTFLYESLWNIVGFILLYIFARKLQKERGEVCFLYFAWYGIGRAAIEGLRTDSLWLFTDSFSATNFNGFNIRISQALGILFFIVGIVLFILARKGKLRKISEPKPKKNAEKAASENTDDYEPLFSDIKAESENDIVINDNSEEVSEQDEGTESEDGGNT